MSTRALYTFLPEDETAQAWNVYKHHDGYPKGAARVIRDTVNWFAWKLPRYESDEFAAAFIAAGKAHSLITYAETKDENEKKLIADGYFPGGTFAGWAGGGVRMMPQGDPNEVAKKYASDIEYRYEIGFKNGVLLVKAFDAGKKKPIFKGSLEAFETWAETQYWAETQ